MRKIAFAVLAAALGAAAPAMAQEAEPQSDIVVTASRLDEMIREFVGEVTVEQQAENQIARWNRKICPQIAGLPARQAQFIADRIAQRAHQVHLRPGGPNCQVNILIFVTPDADRFTRELTSQFPMVFNPRVPNMHQQDNAALERFVGSDAVVRWWHVSQTTMYEGQVVPNGTPRAGRSGEIRDVPVMRTGVTSRIQRTTRQDFNRAIVVVDAAGAAGYRFDALADYVAMVTLAQLNPDADTSSNDTILNLFSAAPSAQPASMTTWDVAYLDGLYSARRNAPNARRQEADISRRMRTAELDDEYLEEDEAP